jgi:hypothetical protein
LKMVEREKERGVIEREREIQKERERGVREANKK